MSDNENDIKLRGSFNSNKDTRGGAQTIPSAVIGIVKNNIDPSRSGRIEVFLLRGNSSKEDSPASWIPVNYMSPFFGYTQNTSSKDDSGKYLGNPNSYGMWMTPPDIGTEVLCVFLNGDINFGYYIGALPKPGMTYMTPALGAGSYVIPNSGEAKSFGGAKRLPVTEANNANKKIKDSSTLADSPRPVHSYQATILFNQGLLKDPDRGAISSSSMRESPSHVFGISTPGRPIYQGGYDDKSIGAAIKADAPNENFKIIGRRGGHSFVMDDGDLYGKDQLIRLRTAGGHTIIMNDYAQTLMIMHANGQSYIELGREGTIDMYSTNSVNIRTEGDLNLHADRNVNINAGGDLKMSGKNTKIEGLQTVTQYAGDTFQSYSKGDYTVKTESNYAVSGAGDIGHKAKGTIFINGGKKKPNVKINSGEISTNPAEVKQVDVNVLSDTLFDDSKGYNPAPAKLTSIVNRAPTHMPWADAGKGVDKKTNKSASAAFPSPPSKATSAVNAAVPKLPSNPTNSTFAATVPGLPDVNNLTKGLNTSLDNSALTGMVSQMAVQAAAGPLGPAVLAGGAGILTNTGTGLKVAGVGSFGLNATQMSQAGIIKPGSDVAVNYALNSGKTLEQAMPNSIFTGQYGTNLNQFINDKTGQTQAAASLLVQGENTLKSSGILSGNEHSTQTAGLIMSTASLGLKATSDFLSSTSSPLSASGLDPQGLANSLTGGMAGSASDLIAGGNFAAGLADKSLVALSGIKLGGIDVAAAVKGFASSLYSSVISAIKPLTANVPQKLDAPAAPTSPAGDLASAVGSATGSLSSLTSAVGAVAGAASSIANDPQLQGLAMQAVTASVPGAGAAIAAANALQSGKSLDANTLASAAIGSSIPGVNVDSLGGLPGGASALSSDSSNKVTSSGISDISGAVNKIAGNIDSSTLGSDLSAAQNLVAGGSLASVAAAGLDPSQLSKLNSLFSVIGHGALNISLPKISSDTFNIAGIKAQAGKLLGDSKIPSPQFGTGKAPDANTAGQAKVTSIGQQISDEQANYDNLSAKYQTTLAKYGYDSKESTDAYKSVHASAEKLDALEKQAQKTTII
jgi:hypothetical protein